MIPSHSDKPTTPTPSDPDRGGRSVLLVRVGPYRILQRLGEGGMGIVYEAEQTEPVRRRVALKVMKIGMDTREVVARFEAERQALAVMAHPSIAKVLDAGASETGRPYFVMELVKGMALTEYCDTHHLSTNERLTLFISICQAVQHAHQKGVIHRDLKPSNVLVTEVDGRALPKIIDFGIAKATGHWLTDKTLVTTYGQAMGTPAYMSPEQAEMSGLDVDTRTDIYAIGVMLYEVLVGRVPVDPSDLGMHGFIAQLVKRETAPPPPSAMLSSLGDEQQTIARFRATDPGSLRRELKGDLDWIVMKAIEQDRARRYETPNDLAGDLQRYLNHEPVIARPPSTSYRMSKFVRRHTAGVVFATVLALLVLAFATTMAIQAGIIARERDRAEQEAAKAQAVNDYMEETLLAPDPIDGMGRDVTVAEALGAAAVKLDEAFPGQPEVEASARSAIGWAYFQLGRYDEAEPLLKQALEIRRETLGPEHRDLAESLYQWARLFHVRAQYDSAEALHHQALEMLRSILGSEHADVVTSLKHLGIMLGDVGRYEEAESVFVEALAAERRHNEESLEIADLQNQIGVLLWNQGKYEELEPLWRQLLITRRKLLGDEHPLVAESMNNLAVLFDNTERPEDAERFYRDALAIMKKTLGSEHEEVSAAMANLAILLDSKGEYEEAERLYREALRIDRKQLGDNNPAVASDLVNLASLLCTIERGDEGLPLLDEAIAIFTLSLEPGNWRIGNTRHWKGRCLLELDRYAEAERELLSGLAIMTDAFGEDHPRVVRVRGQLADLYAAWGQPNKAAPYRAPNEGQHQE